MQDLPNIHLMLNHIRGAYKLIEDEWQKSAKKIGLTQAEQHVLWIVSLEKDVTISRIAEIGLWDVSTVMQVVKRLKEKGYIYIEKKPDDRRVSYAKLTDAGIKKKKESEQHTYKFYDFLKTYFSKSEENAEFLYKTVKFYEQLNQHFYGHEFVNWIDTTYKGIVHEVNAKQKNLSNKGGSNGEEAYKTGKNNLPY